MHKEEKGPSKSWGIGENKHIGDQGEFFCRSLYGLMKHPDGDRRPDLISVNGRYTPKLTMEVKTSMKGNGIVNPYGLTYGFNSNFDYLSILGEDMSKQDSTALIEDMEWDRFSGMQEVAFYYNLMYRTDNKRNEEFKLPFHDLGISFGDQMLLPHDLIFYSYVVGKMRGNGITFDKAFKDVKKMVLGFAREGYDYDNPEKHDCQGVHFNDFLSIFMNDPSLLRSEESKERVNLLLENYGDERMSRLERIQYIGPNNTHVYAFYKPEHGALFVDQLRNRIAERRDVLTRLSQHREKEAAALKEGYVLEPDNHEMDLKLDEGKRRISRAERVSLERLMQWKRAEDNGPEFSELHPVDVEQEHQPAEKNLF